MGSSANADEIPVAQAQVVVVTFPHVCHTDAELLLLLVQVVPKLASYKRIKGVKVFMRVPGADTVTLVKSRLKAFLFHKVNTKSHPTISSDATGHCGKSFSPVALSLSIYCCSFSGSLTGNVQGAKQSS